MEVVGGTDIISFDFNLLYDIQGDFDRHQNFFVETTEGPRLMPHIVPDKARFTLLAQRLADIRKDGQPECSIKVHISGEAGGITYRLLEAHYSLSSNASTFSFSPVDIQQLAVRGHNLSAPTCDEPQIDFRLDIAGHDGLHWIMGSVDVEEHPDTEDDETREGNLGEDAMGENNPAEDDLSSSRLSQ